MARVLAHVFAGAETEAGLKSISYGQTDGTVSAKGDGGNDLTDGLFAGSENDDGFVHLFAAERYVLTVQRRTANDRGNSARAFNAALAALRLMSATQVGRVHVAILFAHYGPVRPDMRPDLFGEVCTVVEHTPTVLARREAMAKRLGEERVGAAELAAVTADERGDAAMWALIQAEHEARAKLDRARLAAARGDVALTRAVESLTAERARSGEPRMVACKLRTKPRSICACDKSCAPRPLVDILAADVQRREALAPLRAAAIPRAEAEVDEARAKRLAFPIACAKQGPVRTARPAREVSVAAIREGANREVSAGSALRDLLRSAGPSVQKLSAVKVRLKVEGDQVLGRAEDAYRAALQGETT